MSHYIPEFLALFTLNFLNILSPGPESALMMYNSSRYSRKVGIFTGLGIVCSTLIHKTYTFLGFGMVVKQSPLLFNFIKYAGSAHLLFLAYRSFFPKVQKQAHEKHPRYVTPKQGFRMGFLMDLLYPGASLFVISMVAASVSINTPLHIQGIYGVLLVLTSLCWYTTFAYICSYPFMQALMNKGGQWIDRIMGAALIFFSIRLALFTV